MHDPALRARAKELRKQGVLIRVIAVELEVPKQTVTRWLNPQLEKRERKRARKLKYEGASRCPRCKRKKVASAKTCRRCQLELRTIERPWPRERVIKAIQAWALKHGHAPTYGEWQKGGKDHPAIRSMMDGPNPLFGSWSEALIAAGFEPRKKRAARKMTPQERAALRRQLREQKILRAVGKENNDHAAGVRDDEGVPDPAGSNTSNVS